MERAADCERNLLAARVQSQQFVLKIQAIGKLLASVFAVARRQQLITSKRQHRALSLVRLKMRGYLV